MQIRSRMSMSADGYVTTPWPGLQVFVLASHRPAGPPGHVVTDSDPERLLDRIRRPTGATFTWLAGRGPSRRSGPSAFWTGSISWCCPCSSAPACN